MSTEPVFEVANGRFVASAYARGPWDANAQHGGAPAALLMRAFERLPTADGLSLARVTYEFLRPAPVGSVEVQAEVVRPGRRVHQPRGRHLIPCAAENHGAFGRVRLVTQMIHQHFDFLSET